ALPYVYGEWGSYGTSALGIFENEDHSFRIQRFETGTYVFSCNDEGVVDIFQYMVEMRASDLIRAYPESVPQTVSHVAKTNPVKPFKVLISISKDYENRGKFPVLSRHIFMGAQDTASWDMPFKNQQLLKESGFYSFPVMVPRWETTPQGDYGVDSPGMLCVSDAAMLQEEERKKYRGLDMLVNPPTVGSANINSTSEELTPGGHTTVLDLRDGGLRPVYEIRFDIAAIAEDIRGVEQRIRNSFYVDIFLHLMELGRSARITAEEARMRDAESLLMLSPALDMITAELLTPMFDRILEMMLRTQALPPPPEALQDTEVA
ncbi:portal protein, partial [Thiolapillus sp.]